MSDSNTKSNVVYADFEKKSINPPEVGDVQDLAQSIQDETEKTKTEVLKTIFNSESFLWRILSIVKPVDPSNLSDLLWKWREAQKQIDHDLNLEEDDTDMNMDIAA